MSSEYSGQASVSGNKLNSQLNPSADSECCPRFDPERWDGKVHNWIKKPFIREAIPTLFHIPFPPMIGKRIGKMVQLAEESKKTEVNKVDTLVLFRDPSAFRSEIYLSVTGSVAGADNVTLSGTFMSKVFAGPYNAIPGFIKQLDEYLTHQGKVAKDYYIHYAYCPKCAEKYGSNYMIIFALIE